MAKGRVCAYIIPILPYLLCFPTHTHAQKRAKTAVAKEYTQQFVFRLLSSASVFIAPLALRRLVSEV